MHKIIHSSFELDLTPYKISTVKENHWFSNVFFTKYSFPFNIDMIDDLLAVFGDYLDHNNTNLVSYFDIKYVFGNVLEAGVLEIEQQGSSLSATIRYGFDVLPNFNKNLSELPLETATITDIFAHAKTIISQTWPAVNYNYPQIHTDKYDPTDATWASFLKIINNYDGTNFIANSWAPGDLQNKNIIQPTPYLLHILTQGFLDAGFTLKGDVTTNLLFKKICVFADIEYYSYEVAPLTALVQKPDYSTLTGDVAVYNTDVLLNIPDQKWRVTGTARMYSVNNGYPSGWTTSTVIISYKGTTHFLSTNIDATEKVVQVDFEFTADGDVAATQLLTLFAQSNYSQITAPIFDLTIEKVIDSGANEIHIKNEVDLTKVVPNVTFGALVSDLKNNMNIDLKIVGKDIYMNFIENSINNSNAVDLRKKEVIFPKRSFEPDKSFLLKFRDVENAPTPYLPVYQSKLVTDFSNKNIVDNTNIIEITALPLPQKSVGTVNTAFSFEHGGDTSIYYLLYNGLTGGLNFSQDPSDLFLPQVHSVFYKKWFKFRVNATTYNWFFIMFSEEVEELEKNLKAFCYGQYHILKTLNKTQIDQDLFKVEIETETM